MSKTFFTRRTRTKHAPAPTVACFNIKGVVGAYVVQLVSDNSSYRMQTVFIQSDSLPSTKVGTTNSYLETPNDRLNPLGGVTTPQLHDLLSRSTLHPARRAHEGSAGWLSLEMHICSFEL